jgi:protein tyrosine phosphatase (PTP) superfamily phosphohydrolase (DUF442 family)
MPIEIARLAAAIAVASGTVLLVGMVAPPGGSAEPPATQGKAAPAPSVPTLADDKPRDFPGIHNVVAFADGFYSGSVPEGDAGFDSLVALGIKTVISVDGAIPEVEKAKARGMRYVHLPIGYDGFDDARKGQLVRAVRDLAKPIYLHCHHGKHRSAGAAGTVGVSLGWITNDVAIARMKVSGTAEGYKGLWACTAKAAPMMSALIDAASADFPEVTKPDSMTAAMVTIDEVFDRLKIVEKNAWVVPKDHPDLAPAADAGKLADLYRLLADDSHVTALADDAARTDFRALLAAGSERAGALETMLAAGAPKSTGVAESDEAAIAEHRKKLSAAMKQITANCKDCHVKYRD